MQIPDSFYFLVGTLIVANIGAIFTGLFAAVKITYQVGKFVRRFEETEEKALKEVGARDMAIRAHKRIDTIETKFAEQ